MTAKIGLSLVLEIMQVEGVRECGADDGVQAYERTSKIKMRQMA